MSEHLRTYDFHQRHALVRIDVQGWAYRGVCACGHVGPRVDGWPRHHHVLLADHLDQALREEDAARDEVAAKIDIAAEKRAAGLPYAVLDDDGEVVVVEAATGDPLWGTANDVSIRRCHGCRALHEPEDGTTYEHRPGCPGVCVQEGCLLPAHLDARERQ